MASKRRVTLDEVVVFFGELADPRSSINRRHPLASVIVIAILLAVPWSDPDFEAQIALARAVNDAQCRLVALLPIAASQQLVSNQGQSGLTSDNSNPSEMPGAD